MKPVFADSGHWMAYFNRADFLHQTAIEVADANRNRQVVTTEMVLAEFLNDAAGRGEHYRTAAAEFVNDLGTEPTIRVIPQSSEQFTAALELFLNRPDKQWSLTDCSSFVVCEREGITEAFAHDIHFQQAGITPLLRQSKKESKK